MASTSLLAACCNLILVIGLSRSARASTTECASTCIQRNRCVVIDPGHPSEVNSGTQRINGISERDVNWIIAKKLQQQLSEKGLEGILTRDDSLQTMTNEARANFANCARPALFLRLHADAANTSGFAVYYATNEGRVKGVVGPPLTVRRESAKWACTIESQMRSYLQGYGISSRGVKSESETAIGAKQGALTGSIVSRMPTVLVEMVVLTNTNDARFIQTKPGQDAMATAIVRGIVKRLVEHHECQITPKSGS